MLVILGILIFAPSLRADDRPNFVFILADDQGWTSTSVSMDPRLPEAKSDYHSTPNLERLARSGMRFTRGYAAAPICCPSRRSLQFGQTPFRQGDDIEFKQRYPARNDRPTIPRLLKSADPRYAAAHFGKWDLRTDLTPELLGYDESDGATGNREGNCLDESHCHPDGDFSETKWTQTAVVDDPKRIFSVTNRGRDFMRRMTSAGRPFFLQLSHYAVHAAFQTRQSTLERWRKKGPGRIHQVPEFAAMTADLDESLGAILGELEALGIQDRTYVIYTSDNGGVGWFPPDRAIHLAPPATIRSPGNNSPLRGGKWVAYEGGIRVPFIVSGPGIRPGSFCDVPIVGWDLLPTIADLAGCEQKLPEDVDGVSFRTLLRGGSRLHRPFEGLVFNRYSDSYGHVAIRVGDYKLVRFEPFPCADCTEPLGLFDLSRDLGEAQNLAPSLPDKVRELDACLREYAHEVRKSTAKMSPQGEFRGSRRAIPD